MELRGLRHTLHHSRFLFKHPRALVRAMVGLFRTMVLKETRLRVIEWVINYECDSHCVFCYATKYNEDGKKPLSPAEIEKNSGMMSMPLYALPSKSKPYKPLPAPNIFILAYNKILLDVLCIWVDSKKFEANWCILEQTYS